MFEGKVTSYGKDINHEEAPNHEDPRQNRADKKQLPLPFFADDPYLSHVPPLIRIKDTLFKHSLIYYISF